jgi:hypothetical protein
MSLDDGDVQPILREIKHPGRPRGSAGRESLKGTADFTVDHLVHVCGLSPEQAREAVAEVLRNEDVMAARGRFPETTARTVGGWCEDVAADVGRHGEAAQTFDEAARSFAPVRGNDRQTIRPALLEALAHVVRETLAPGQRRGR